MHVHRGLKYQENLTWSVTKHDASQTHFEVLLFYAYFRLGKDNKKDKGAPQR